MPYPRLKLQCADVRVAATISMFTEPSLQEAHNLICTAFPNGDAPGHFGYAAAILTLVSIAGASAVRYLDLATNKPIKGHLDKDIFPACVEKFFPWSAIRITDRDYIAKGYQRPQTELRKEVAGTLYTTLRNPLLHAGGAVSKRFPKISIVHPFPGRSFQEVDQDLCDQCNWSTLNEEVLSFDSSGTRLVTRPLYWATRKMIEAIAADPDVQADIMKHHAIV